MDSKIYDEWERQEDIDLGEKMMDELTDFFNKNNSTAQKAFVQKFEREHRTLQQNVLRAFFQIMVKSADRYEKKDFDPRNEQGLEACHIMVNCYAKEKGYAPVYLAHI